MPIDTDGTIAENNNLTVDDAADAILKQWSVKDEDASEPSKKSEEEDTEELDTEDDPETDEDAEELSDEDEDEADDADSDEEETDEDEGDDKPKKALDDEAVVKVKVGEEELDVAVKDLKRLYGQEAALTRKSQAVAAKTKEVEETGAKYVASLAGLLERAKQRAEPFSKIDFLVASKDLSTDELKALREEANRQFDDVRFLEQEIDRFMVDVKRQRETGLIEQAKECVRVLKQDIPEWNERLYDDLRSYAVSEGFDKEMINNLVEPAAFKLIHKAYLFSKGQKAVTTKKAKAPTKVIKSTTAPSTTKEIVGKRGVEKALERARRTGSLDDAASAFLAKWQKD